MIRLYGLFFVVDLVLTVVALIDCLSTDEHAVRNLPKVAWVFIVLLFSPVGPIVWFVAGRPQDRRVGRAGQWRPGNGFPEYERPRSVGPDDDPDFLKSVSRLRREDEEMFAKWEADLRRREEELRRRERENRRD
ncbi:PLD nuclease N-terminal domain-containing protein [Planosporangium sp. 12N6]|uniref:PLD nuclease N-terminal domain-containing protein n=1 Tax=Planosporangium spinosum TaxID=3402278 RepID=UPI003CF18C0B